MPKFDWTFEKDGAIRVTTTDKPTEVKLWQATNPKARDFRLVTIGATWVGSTIEAGADGAYVGRAAAPPQGYTAFFVELTFPSGAAVPFKFTTATRVVPDALPFKFEPRRPQ
jgi:PhoPQ-activated pathogenicity-related protein